MDHTGPELPLFDVYCTHMHINSACLTTTYLHQNMHGILLGRCGWWVCGYADNFSGVYAYRGKKFQIILLC